MKAIHINWRLVALTYILLILAFSFSAKATPYTTSPSQNLDQKNITFISGQIYLGQEGSVFLLPLDGGPSVELLSHEIDLASFDLQIVEVAGFSPSYQAGPVKQPVLLSQISVASFVVTEILILE